MTLKPNDELKQDELDAQNGETLPEREVMSVVSVDPQPVEILHPAEEPLPPGQDPTTDPGPPQE